MKQLLLGCWFLSLPLLAAEWPEIQFPDSATVEVVAEEMVYQGTPMATWVMRDKSNQMMTAAFFKRQWQGKSERFDEQMFGQDYIINSLQPPFLLTARIRKDFDGVLAYIGISKDPGSPVHSKLAFPMPSGSTVLSDVSSKDLFKSGRTLVFNSNRTLADTFHYYQRHFQRQGWSEVGTYLDSEIGTLMFTKGSNTLDISINRKNGLVYVVANQVMEGI
ncbi:MULTISPECIES: hypothetical protein [Shewanella]|uniref:hypothetical protein n=1 Tax=Shewanella algae TaxID=38313 RepID=UPI001AAC5C71|nr:hypothetical protein [Shewanella algae]QTE91011.1 hypothetical protein JKK33_00905 [Shewanella algae]BCV30656.1 hypothetical protein TUM4442_01830 [Shewanella algae]